MYNLYYSHRPRPDCGLMTTSRRGGAGRACQLPSRLSSATACAAAPSFTQRSTGLCASCLNTNSSGFSPHPTQRSRHSLPACKTFAVSADIQGQRVIPEQDRGIRRDS